MRTGILVLNFGEPEDPVLKQVVPFLERIFLRNASLEEDPPAATAPKAPTAPAPPTARAHERSRELARRRAPASSRSIARSGAPR